MKKIIAGRGKGRGTTGRVDASTSSNSGSITTTSALEELKLLSHHGKIIVEDSVLFLCYLFRDTDNLPQLNIAGFLNHDMAYEKINQTRTGKLLQSLISTPAYKVIAQPDKPEEPTSKKTMVNISICPFISVVGDLSIPRSLLKEQGNCVTISEYLFRGNDETLVEDSGIHPIFQKNHAVLRSFVKLHALLHELAKLLLTCDSACELLKAGSAGRLSEISDTTIVLMDLLKSVFEELRKTQQELVIVGATRLAGIKKGEIEQHPSDMLWLGNFKQAHALRKKMAPGFQECLGYVDQVTDRANCSKISAFDFKKKPDETIQALAKSSERHEKHLNIFLKKLGEPAMKAQSTTRQPTSENAVKTWVRPRQHSAPPVYTANAQDSTSSADNRLPESSPPLSPASSRPKPPSTSPSLPSGQVAEGQGKVWRRSVTAQANQSEPRRGRLSLGPQKRTKSQPPTSRRTETMTPELLKELKEALEKSPSLGRAKTDEGLSLSPTQTNTGRGVSSPTPAARKETKASSLAEEKPLSEEPAWTFAITQTQDLGASTSSRPIAPPRGVAPLSPATSRKVVAQPAPTSPESSQSNVSGKEEDLEVRSTPAIMTDAPLADSNADNPRSPASSRKWTSPRSAEKTLVASRSDAESSQPKLGSPRSPAVPKKVGGQVAVARSSTASNSDPDSSRSPLGSPRSPAVPKKVDSQVAAARSRTASASDPDSSRPLLGSPRSPAMPKKVDSQVAAARSRTASAADSDKAQPKLASPRSLAVHQKMPDQALTVKPADPGLGQAKSSYQPASGSHREVEKPASQTVVAEHTAPKAKAESLHSLGSSATADKPETVAQSSSAVSGKTDKPATVAQSSSDMLGKIDKPVTVAQSSSAVSGKTDKPATVAQSSSGVLAKIDKPATATQSPSDTVGKVDKQPAVTTPLRVEQTAPQDKALAAPPSSAQQKVEKPTVVTKSEPVVPQTTADRLQSPGSHRKVSNKSAVSEKGATSEVVNPASKFNKLPSPPPSPRASRGSQALGSPRLSRASQPVASSTKGDDLKGSPSQDINAKTLSFSSGSSTKSESAASATTPPATENAQRFWVSPRKPGQGDIKTATSNNQDAGGIPQATDAANNEVVTVAPLLGKLVIKRPPSPRQLSQQPKVLADKPAEAVTVVPKGSHANFRPKLDPAKIPVGLRRKLKKDKTRDEAAEASPDEATNTGSPRTVAIAAAPQTNETKVESPRSVRFDDRPVVEQKEPALIELDAEPKKVSLLSLVDCAESPLVALVEEPVAKPRKRKIELFGINKPENEELNREITDMNLVSVMKEHLASDPLVTELFLQKNNIGSAGAVLLCEMLSTITTLEHLNLSSNPALLSNTSSVMAVSALLKQADFPIRDLLLSNCGLDAEGACFLASGLRENQTLEFLDLSRNYIEDEGVQRICEALFDHPTLKYILLNHNYLKDDGALYLLQLVLKNPRIEFLEQRGNDFHNQDFDNIENQVKANREANELAESDSSLNKTM